MWMKQFLHYTWMNAASWNSDNYIYNCRFYSLPLLGQIYIAVYSNFMVRIWTWNSHTFWHPSGFYKLKANTTLSLSVFLLNCMWILGRKCQLYRWISRKLNKIFSMSLYKHVLLILVSRAQKRVCKYLIPSRHKNRLKMIKKIDKMTFK